jgi:hypothetical protein
MSGFCDTLQRSCINTQRPQPAKMACWQHCLHRRQLARRTGGRLATQLPQQAVGKTRAGFCARCQLGSQAAQQRRCSPHHRQQHLPCTQHCHTRISKVSSTACDGTKALDPCSYIGLQLLHKISNPVLRCGKAQYPVSQQAAAHPVAFTAPQVRHLAQLHLRPGVVLPDDGGVQQRRHVRLRQEGAVRGERQRQHPAHRLQQPRVHLHTGRSASAGGAVQLQYSCISGSAAHATGTGFNAPQLRCDCVTPCVHSLQGWATVARRCGVSAPR